MKESKEKNNYEDVLLKISMPGKTLRDETIRRMQEKAKETPASEPDFNSKITQTQQTESQEEEQPEVPQQIEQQITQEQTETISNSQINQQQTQNNYQEQSQSPHIQTQQTESQEEEQPEVPQQIEQQITQEQIIQQTEGEIEQQPEKTKEQIEQEEILQRLTMPKKEILGAEPERDESTDTRKDPYIYKYGHPHLGSNFNMDTIKNLTNNILDGTKYSKKQKK